MPDGEITAIKVINDISKVDTKVWNLCAGPDNPFVSHEFLEALERSKAACGESGWLPQHLLIEDSNGNLLGCVPCYLKSHSYGEYVFDWGWADAFERAGGQYYPKLQISVPFTPVTGPRLLVKENSQNSEIKQMLISGVCELAERCKVSSMHITFCEKEELKILKKMNFLTRLGKQFHWHNRGYTNFDDFLGTLTSRKRKTIRKERTTVNKDIDIEILCGDDLKTKHMDAFYKFYLSTVEKKWAHAYLNRDFFDKIQDLLSEKIILIMARQDGNFIGSALNFCGSDTLYGRNWGGLPQFKFLYFEVCFYRAIEFAIEKGLKRVEAGAQGPHKISRGYLPTKTYSAHWIRDPAFRSAVSKFLIQEQKETKWEMDMLTKELSPYRNN